MLLRIAGAFIDFFTYCFSFLVSMVMMDDDEVDDKSSNDDDIRLKLCWIGSRTTFLSITYRDC
jgi:hypothetical protein